jgi:SHS2 domain-containing protein
VAVRFSEIDHSGDIGIEAEGRDLVDLIEGMTEGLFALFCRGGVAARVERRLEVTSTSVEDLLVDWLGEVIAAVGSHGELYVDVEIVEAGDFFVKGVLSGEKVDEDRHDLRFDVKAATYHGLMIDKRGAGYFGRVIFDL